LETSCTPNLTSVSAAHGEMPDTGGTAEKYLLRSDCSILLRTLAPTAAKVCNPPVREGCRLRPSADLGQDHRRCGAASRKRSLEHRAAPGFSEWRQRGQSRLVQMRRLPKLLNSLYLGTISSPISAQPGPSGSVMFRPVETRRIKQHED